MKRLALIVLTCVLVLTAFLGWRMSKVGFDYDFEKFFPANDPDTEFFLEYRKKFGSDNDFVLFALSNNNGVFREDFLRRVDSFSNELRKIPYVTRVYSIIDYRDLVMTSFSRVPFPVPAIHMDDPESYGPDSSKIFEDNLLVRNLISADAKTVLVYVDTKQYISKNASDSLALFIDEVMDRYSFDGKISAGRSTGQSYYVKLMQYELGFFAITSFILVIAFLYLSFRTCWGVWVPVTVVVFTAVWIIGFMEIVGEGISLVLTILPTIMFVVGMSDVVHVISRYVEELRSGKGKIDALRITYKEVALATLLTSVTTAVGFLSLLTSTIEPIRDFGLYTALGVMFAFVLAYTLLPAILLLHPVPSIAAIPQEKNFWQRFLSKAFVVVIRKRMLIIFISIATAGVSIWGITQMRINNFLLEDLKDGNELKEQFRFFEREFAGVRPLEMAILVKNADSIPVSRSVLIELEKLENYLITEYGAGTIISPLTLVRSVNRTINGGDKRHYSIPDSDEDLKKVFRMIEKLGADQLLSGMIADNGRTLRLAAKTNDLGSYVYKKKDAELRQFYKRSIDTSVFDYRLTGTALLVDKNNGQVAFGLVWGLGISFVVIAMIVGLMYRSGQMIWIALLPNILPLLMIAGVMGILGIDLKVSTSMMFTISFGIAVDDTIHFISKLRIELSKGRSMMFAVRKTFVSTGRAIILTTIILSGGFLTLIFSDFLGTYYLGLLMALTLFFAVLCDLLLLPVLVIMFYKPRKSEW